MTTLNYPMRRGRALVPFVVALLTLAACTTSTEQTSTTSSTFPSTTALPVEETSTTAPTTTTTTTPATSTVPEAAAVPFAGLVLPTDAGTHFSGSGSCAACHTGMTDADGNDISIDTTWRSTMMANAARDPYWQATVRAEVTKAPELADVVEDKCSTCHMPMARATDSFSGESGAIFDSGYQDPANPLHVLAMDGVSCTTCHQIDPGNLSTEESYSGGFIIDPDTPRGQRITYGPFAVTRQAERVMTNVSGFVPVQSPHIQESAVCATCHTLYTPYIDATGAVAGLFPEQTPFLELQASSVGASCQDCHMPIADGEVAVSIVAGQPRSEVSRHLFVGGNDYLLSIMSVFGDNMGLTASSEHVAATRDRINEQLAVSTAALDIGTPSWEDNLLTVPIEIRNATGHKFPTGFPSRRTWLHVTLTNAAGDVVFESGAWTPDGAIAGNDNDDNPTGFEPHYDAVTDPEQVQIYETILLTTDEEVTTTLLRGATYAKDNRLLPEGFDKNAVAADIAVHGAAVDDTDFEGGRDVVEYRIDTSGFSGPFRLHAEVLYQSIGYRWAANLSDVDGPEIATFLSYYQAVPNLPVVVASHELDLAR